VTEATFPASRFCASELTHFAAALLSAAGMAVNKAEPVAASLVNADLAGHATHGLALLPWYLDAIDSGSVTLDGTVEVINDSGACVTWNGRGLPGAWLIGRAIDLALERVGTHGLVTIVIGNSHHTGALATYLSRLTEHGLMVMLACSAPASATVAPFGGREALLSPNPIAAGIPTNGDPILVDISASITTVNNARQLSAAGERFPAPWALDAEGRPSEDPACVVSGGGSLLPVGGLDHGHKGYAMALLVEALTQGLAGQGRIDRPRGAVMGVWLQVIDPQAFAGKPAFVRQTSWLAEACTSNPPRAGVERVRLPGGKAAQQRRDGITRGMPLSSAIIDAIVPHANRHGLTFPQPIDR
jgi:L-lactate dehydrogenase